MNHEIWRLFKNLPEGRKAALHSVFADSPKTLRLLAFLADNEGDFKTIKAVKAIYQEELADTELEVLINRYYKLRQGLREWLLEQMEENVNYFLPEEQQLAFLRTMVAKNEFGYALSQLKKLEERCERLFFYELLVEVRQMMLLCYQSISHVHGDGVMDQLQIYEERWEKALAYWHCLQQIRLIFRKTFRHDTIKTGIEQIKRLCQQHKDQARFNYIYHYVAFVRGMFLPGMAEKSTNALMRHLNEVKRLRKLHPEMPMTQLERYYVEKLQGDLLLHEAIFLYNKGRMADAVALIEEREQWRLKDPNFCPRRSEAEYNNLLVFYTMSNDYERAVQVIEELREFKEQQGPIYNEHMLYIAWLRIYTFGYPKVLCDNLSHFVQKVDSVLSNTKDQPQFYGYLLGAKIDFLWQYGLLKKSDLKHFFDYSTAWEAYTYHGFDLESAKQFFAYVLAKDLKAAKAHLLASCPSDNPRHALGLAQHRSWLLSLLK